MTKINCQTEEKAPLPSSPTPAYQLMMPAPTYALAPPSQNSTEMRQSTVWYVLSILAALFCCLPFGIIGIVHAMMAKHDGEHGRLISQRSRLRQAKCWTCWAFSLGLLAMIAATFVILYQLGIIGYYYRCGTDDQMVDYDYRYPHYTPGFNLTIFKTVY